MKVVFLKDVAKVGKRFETKDISDGYALNFLIPNGFVEAATTGVKKRLETEKARALGEQKVHEALLLQNLKQLDGVTVTISEKANEKGHLFAGLHKAEIAPKITEQTRVQINPDFIVLDKPIKQVGEHEITVKVHDKSAKFKLVVVKA